MFWESCPRTIVIRFASFKPKEEVLRLNWKKKGFQYQEKKAILDHNYTPDIARKHQGIHRGKESVERKQTTLPNTIPGRIIEGS